MIRLGEFEEVILLLVGILGDEAYAFNLVKELKEDMGRTVSVGAVHATLNRLESKGLLTSEVGGATAKRGGRRKRVYTITAQGQEALVAARDMKIALWQQYPPLALEKLSFGF